MIVNAAATLTALGGSVMAEPVIAAMAEAARSYIDLSAAYVTAGERIAELTGNEGAAVTAGASSAITLAVASLITGPEPEGTQDFPLRESSARHVVMLAPQRNDYDFAVRLLGVDIRESADEADALRAALSDDPVCVLWFAGTQYPAPGLTLAEIIAIADERSVPVVVDSAAQIPPLSSLRDFTVGLGAAAAIFSGGKGLGGPQDSAIVVGRSDVTTGIRRHMAPNHGVGRGMKVTKESLAGILAALDHALSLDEARLLDGWETTVAEWIAEATDAGLVARRDYPSEAGQPHSRAFVSFASPDEAEEAKRFLWEREPQVAVLVVGSSIALNPQPLQPGHEREVSAAIADLATQFSRRSA